MTRPPPRLSIPIRPIVTSRTPEIYAACATWVFIAISLFGEPAFGQADATTIPSARADWLKWAPGDTRLFLEFRNLSQVRAIFRTRGIWEAVQQLSTPASTTQPWQLHAERSLGMTPDQAIDELLGVRAALLAVDPARWQVGVVIAELPPQGDVRAVLRRWRAREDKTDGPVNRYTLPGGLGLAVRGRVLLFGPTADPDGLWDRSAALLADRAGPTLAGRADVAALRADAPKEYSCLIYTSWTEAVTADDPRTNRLLCTANVTSEGIDCELRGNVRPGEGAAATWTPEELAKLPGDAAFLWARSYAPVDFQRWLAADDTPLTSLSAVLFHTFVAKQDDRRAMAKSLGPRVTWVGDVRPTRTRGEAVVPAVAVVCESRDAEALTQRIDSAMALITGFLDLVSGTLTTQEASPVQTEVIGKHTLHWLDWGRQLEKRLSLPAMNTVQPCWFAADGQWVMATTRTLAKRLLDARSEPAARVRQKWLESFASKTPITDYFRIDGQKIAALIQGWDGYLSRTHPEVLNPTFWKEWADRRLEDRRRLGVTLKAAPDQSGAEVVDVEVGSPAEGRLESGDIIVEAAGRPAATSRPTQIVAEAFEQSRESGAFQLVYMRRGEQRSVVIPLPKMPSFAEGFDPVGTLRRLASLAARIETVSVIGRMGPGPRVEARGQLRWKQTGGPTSP